MIQQFKVGLRDLLPGRLQVPAKYWFSHFRGSIEAEMALLPHLAGPGRRAIDIGGNRGIYAYALAKLGATVEVFEPNPACVAGLLPWAATAPNITVHPVALSSHAGEAALHIPRGANGVEHDSSASIEHVADGDMRDEIVVLRTLDSFGFRDVAIIKIDVEGHEYDVISGARDTIYANRPALLVEIEQRHLSRPIGDVFATLLRQDYRGFFLLDRKLVPIDRFEVSRHQSPAAFASGSDYHNNFLFLAADRLAAGDYATLVQQWAAV